MKNKTLLSLSWLLVIISLTGGSCPPGPTPPQPPSGQKDNCKDYSAAECAKATPLSGKKCEVANGLCRDAVTPPPPDQKANCKDYSATECANATPLSGKKCEVANGLCRDFVVQPLDPVADPTRTVINTQADYKTYPAFGGTGTAKREPIWTIAQHGARVSPSITVVKSDPTFRLYVAQPANNITPASQIPLGWNQITVTQYNILAQTYIGFNKFGETGGPSQYLKNNVLQNLDANFWTYLDSLTRHQNLAKHIQKFLPVSNLFCFQEVMEDDFLKIKETAPDYLGVYLYLLGSKQGVAVFLNPARFSALDLNQVAVDVFDNSKSAIWIKLGMPANPPSGSGADLLVRCGHVRFSNVAAQQDQYIQDFLKLPTQPVLTAKNALWMADFNADKTTVNDVVARKAIQFGSFTPETFSQEMHTFYSLGGTKPQQIDQIYFAGANGKAAFGNFYDQFGTKLYGTATQRLVDPAGSAAVTLSDEIPSDHLPLTVDISVAP